MKVGFFFDNGDVEWVETSNTLNRYYATGNLLGEMINIRFAHPCPPPANLRTVDEGAVVIPEDQWERLREVFTHWSKFIPRWAPTRSDSAISHECHAVLITLDALLAAHPAPVAKVDEAEGEAERIVSEVDRLADSIQEHLEKAMKEIVAIKKGGA